MNLLYALIGLLLAFGISLGILYAMNLKEENRYKQLYLPLIALILFLPMLLLDVKMTRLYQQFFDSKLSFFSPYVGLMLNLTFVFLFLLVKVLWRTTRSLRGSRIANKSRMLKSMVHLAEKMAHVVYPKEKIDSWKNSFEEPDTISLVYVKKGGNVFLKKEWTYVNIFFKFAAIFPAILLLLLIIAYVYGLSLSQYLPKYPVVTLILLLEAAWFLAGRKIPYGTGSIGGKDAVSSKLAIYEELFDQYKELWPERLLAFGKINENEHFHHRSNHFSYENLSPDHEHQKVINAICARLKKKNLIIDESYTTIMSEIIQENDCIIEDCLYDEFADYFFPALYHLLTKNKKILVIAPNQGAAYLAVNWIDGGIDQVSGLEAAWKVSTFADALEQNTNPDILVVSPDILEEKRFLQYFNQLEKSKIMEAIMLIQAEKIIPSYSSIIHTFNLNVREQIGKKPQYIVLTEWNEGLEHTIRMVLQCVPKDIFASTNPSRNVHYMIWKKEGEKWFQHTVLPKISHRQLEAEAVLSLPAIRSNIEPVHFVSQRKTNVQESIHEILNAKRSLFELGFDLETLDHFLQMIKIHDQNFCVPVDEFAFLILRDSKYNVVDALNLWKDMGKLATFVHIVSPPYLLRDYLTSELEFFLSTNRTISPLAPRLSQSVWSIAYYLLERLSQFFISEEEVETFLRKAKIHSYRSVVEGIHKLFTDAFGPVLEYRYNIESEEKLIFNRNKKDFVGQTRYRIPFSAREKILPKGLRFIKIKHNDRTISEIFEGHVYQQYLEGQYHSFNGELYKIQKIDLEQGIIELNFEPIFEKKYYRRKTEYRIGKVKEDLYTETKNIAFEKFELSMGEIHAHLQSVTSGYLELHQLLNLQSVKFHSFDKADQIFTNYENGHLLRIQIRPKEGQLEDAAKIEFTLAFLLNELFLTLFPESHQFVTACIVKDHLKFDETDPLSKKLASVTPTIQLGGGIVRKGDITLYIVEDSPLHMGLLETIRDHWEKIFDILNDYLHWLLKESNSASDFLHFGYDRFPKEFALTRAYNIIDELLTRKKLREVRTEYLERKEDGNLVKITGSENQCIFCGKMVSASQFHELDDGRKRCFTCSQSAIDRVSQVEELYLKVREFFKGEYGAVLPTDIEVSVLSTAEIHNMNGLPFVPNAGHPHISGMASIDAIGNLKVYVENGSPRVHTLSTLAHELTHIWQYRNMNVIELLPEEIEGFASWVEVHMMTKEGEIPYANMLHQQLLIRNDVYGEGYRLILERLKRLHDEATPFELYAAEGVRG